MRRLGISVAVVLAGLVLLPAAAAQATFHLNKVNEVMLAAGTLYAAYRGQAYQFMALLSAAGLVGVCYLRRAAK